MKNFLIRFLFLSVLFPFSAHAEAPQKNRLTIQSGKNKISFNIDVADDESEREQGLMFRKELKKNAGMLFLFKFERVEGFWMKNTLIPLDIIFIARGGEIVRIHHMAKPMDLTLLSSQVPVVAALEIKGGEAAKRGIKPGDRVIYPIFAN